MTVGLGWEAQIGLGHESTWGVSVARTRFIDQVSVSGGQLIPLIERETFRGRSPVIPYRGAELIDGVITSELQYEGWEDLFYHLFGKKATATTNTTAKQHTFSFDDAVAMPVGLTVEVKYGAAATELWPGCKVESVELTADVDKVMKAAFRVVGGLVESGSASTASFPTAPTILWDGMVIKKDGVSTPVRSLKMNISNGYKTDRRALGTGVLEHVPGRRAISGTLVADFENLTAWKNSMVNDTTHELIVQGLDGVIAGSSPQDQYEFLLTIPKIKIETHDTPISDAGIISQEVGFRAHKESLELATLVITNLRATIP